MTTMEKMPALFARQRQHTSKMLECFFVTSCAPTRCSPKWCRPLFLCISPILFKFSIFWFIVGCPELPCFFQCKLQTQSSQDSNGILFFPVVPFVCLWAVLHTCSPLWRVFFSPSPPPPTQTHVPFTTWLSFTLFLFGATAQSDCRSFL